MQIFSLCCNVNAPCYIVKYRSLTIMMDVAIDMSCMMKFLPVTAGKGGMFDNMADWIPNQGPALTSKLGSEIKESLGNIYINSAPELIIPNIRSLDISEIDLIIISNAKTLLGLPFITESGEFKGQIYATEPTIKFGKLMMDEFEENLSVCSLLDKAERWKKPALRAHIPMTLVENALPLTWRNIYSKEDIKNCIQKMTKIGFGQKMDVYGCATVTAIASGFSIGSCNWIIESHYEKIVYISSTSAFTTHPKSLVKEPLKKASVLVISGITNTPQFNPDDMIGDFCTEACQTLKKGGNVLVPCFSTGTLYDLLECIVINLEQYHLATVPIYFVSSGAKASLDLSNIYSEWLSDKKKNKVYMPETPFIHDELVKNGRLSYFSALDRDFNMNVKSPFIIFAGHPTLRCGPCVTLMQLMKNNPDNMVIFTVPDFDVTDILAPYQPLAMKIRFKPIDTSMSFAQANHILSSLAPSHCVVPSQYFQTIPGHESLSIAKTPNMIDLHPNCAISIKLNTKFEKVFMEQNLAKSLKPSEINDKVQVVNVMANLKEHNNQYSITGLDKIGKRKYKKNTNKLFLGCININDLCYALKEIKLENSSIKIINPRMISIKSNSDVYKIHLNENDTNIECDNVEIQVKIAKCVTSLLASI